MRVSEIDFLPLSQVSAILPALSLSFRVAVEFSAFYAKRIEKGCIVPGFTGECSNVDGVG
jgi:hypothetical protein